jgi:hypothetical protein
VKKPGVGDARAARRLAKHKEFLDGEYNALVVAARMAGVPKEMIDKYAGLGAREKFNKREVFDYWLEVIDKMAVKPTAPNPHLHSSGLRRGHYFPTNTIPVNWLTWVGMQAHKVTMAKAK